MEACLQGATPSIRTLAKAVALVLEDVQPGNVPDKDFLITAAQGLLFEALASILKPVRQQEVLLP